MKFFITSGQGNVCLSFISFLQRNIFFPQKIIMSVERTEIPNVFPFVKMVKKQTWRYTVENFGCG